MLHHLTRTWTHTTEVDGLPVTDIGRTALDLGREHGVETGVMACDAALARGLPRAALEERVNVMTCWPHITRARAALDLADPGAESPGESLARLLVMELGVGRPQTQFAVAVGGSVAWCDLLLGCHIFEFDGRVKYLQVEQGGVATRPVEDVLWDERTRQHLICAEGLGMSRIVWADFWGARRGQAIRRIRAEHQVTVERFGSELPFHLAEFAELMRGRRRTAS